MWPSARSLIAVSYPMLREAPMRKNFILMVIEGMLVESVWWWMTSNLVITQFKYCRQTQIRHVVGTLHHILFQTCRGEDERSAETAKAD